MKQRLSRIPVPSSDARRDRVEQAVFAELARHRSAGDVDARLYAERPWWRSGFALAGLATAIATTALLVVALRGPAPVELGRGPHPSQVITPEGGATHLALGDVTLDVGSDTLVDVVDLPEGGLSFTLQRGRIDCTVAPRQGRAPVMVQAGTVVVEVVGTQFRVERDGAQVRVEVTHGTVKIASDGVITRVGGGEVWLSEPAQPPQAQLVEPAPGPEPTPTPAAPIATPAPMKPPAPVRAPAPTPAPVPTITFDQAQRLEATDRSAARRAYRALANGKDSWAPVALYALAQLDATHGQSRAALAALDEYERRFPRGAQLEDAAWLRVEALRGGGRTAEARAAAASYLRRFPAGIYAPSAQRIVDAAP